MNTVAGHGVSNAAVDRLDVDLLRSRFHLELPGHPVKRTRFPGKGCGAPSPGGPHRSEENRVSNDIVAVVVTSAAPVAIALIKAIQKIVIAWITRHRKKKNK